MFHCCSAIVRLPYYNFFLMRTTPENGYPENWPEIAEACKARDHYTCQHCGTKAGEVMNYRGTIAVMAAAHKFPPVTNCDLSNLITLCQRCHFIYDNHDGSSPGAAGFITDELTS